MVSVLENRLFVEEVLCCVVGSWKAGLGDRWLLGPWWAGWLLWIEANAACRKSIFAVISI